MNIKIENEFFEFRESIGQLSKAAESIVAMLNKHSKATILFGVKDNGDIVGVNLANKTLRDIETLLTQKIKPSINPAVIEENLEGKTVIKIEVTGDDKPYCADGNYLIRSGNDNKKIEPEIMKQMLISKSVEQVSEIESFDQNLSFNQLKQLYVLNGQSMNKTTFAKNNGLLTKNRKYNLPANLLSDNNNFSISVLRYAGKDKSKMISRNEHGYKCIVAAFQSALDDVLSLNETKMESTGNGLKKELHLFDENSFKEAWINAFLYTRWDQMVPPIVYIFKDRIEIVSTGGLPNDHSINNFYNGVNNPINKQLQKIFAQLGIVDQKSYGVLEIIKHYGREAISISDNHIVITLKFPFEISNKGNIYSSLIGSQEKVLKAIIAKPSITTNELVKVVNLGTSRIAIILKELKELNTIKRIGSNKNGYWEVINKQNQQF